MSEEPRREQTEVVSRARPKRWWNDLRWITAGVVTLTLAFLAWGLFGPEPPIRVSRETTYFTEPLAADGLPDYRAAILAMEGPKPPPEENAAAALLQVCWPLGISESHLPAVCEALGIPCEPPERPLREPHRDAASKISRDEFDAALERPWTRTDLPDLAAWLVTHEAAIDRVVAGCDRPRYWLPSPSLLRDETGPLFLLLLQGSSEFREAARMLKCRALWHLGERRHVETWRDVRAIYRLGRLLAAPERRAVLAITPIVAGSLEAMADEVMTYALLADDALPRELLADIRSDLDGLGRSGRVAEFFPMERANVIDTLVFIAAREPGGRSGRGGWLGIGLLKKMGNPFAALLLRTSIDWNEILKSANEVFDRHDSAWKLPTFAERRASLNQSEADFVARGKSWGGAHMAFTVLVNRGARSECLGARLMNELMPALASVVDTITVTEARFTLVETAVALAAWRLDHKPNGKKYPERLDELVPTYLPAVPIDPFSDKPLVYERRDDGYLLVSLGKNCDYDGGTDGSGWIVNGEWQDEQRIRPHNDDYDLVVRMPVPRRSFAVPVTP